MGVAVTVVEAAAGLMPTQLDQHAGKALKARLAELGIAVLMAAITQRIEAAGSQRTLHLAGGERLTVDMVVVAAGIRPRTQLAASCDLGIAPDGGVIVANGA